VIEAKECFKQFRYRCALNRQLAVATFENIPANPGRARLHEVMLCNFPMINTNPRVRAGGKQERHRHRIEHRDER
jgi:hypothetical protein